MNRARPGFSWTSSLVLYDAVVVGDYVVDLMVEQLIMVASKAVRAMHEVHNTQRWNDLMESKARLGLLPNFVVPRLEINRVVNGL
jgi:GxxExxY protein